MNEQIIEQFNNLFNLAQHKLDPAHMINWLGESLWEMCDRIDEEDMEEFNRILTSVENSQNSINTDVEGI